MDKRAILIIFLLFVVALVGGVSFSSSPIINEGSNATTSQALTCAWTSSGDTTSTNVTWYRDGSHFSNTTSATSPSTVSSSNTARGQIWNCTVILGNGTDTNSSSDLIEIINANPSNIIVSNESSIDIENKTTILEDIARVFTVNATDPDGDEVIYSTIGLPSNANFVSSTGVMSWTPNASQVGNTTITFIALDNQTPDRGSSAKDVVFEVLEVNDNPVFNPALTNQTATEDTVYTYNIIVTDEESDFPIQFNLTTNLSSIDINITGNTTATIYFTAGAPDYDDRGNHTITVNITDARGGFASSTFNLEVSTVNQNPNITAPANASGTQNTNFTYLVNATDLDLSDTLTFAITPISCGLSNPWTLVKQAQVSIGNYTFANATINQNITNNHVVCNTVNISVTDGETTVYQAVSFNLTNTNDAPIISDNSVHASNTGGNNITNQSGYTNTTYTYVVNGSDVDSLTYENEVLLFQDNTTLFDINSTTGVISFTPNSSGNYSILINLTDDQGLFDSIIMTLRIEANSAPVLNNISNITCQEDQLCTVFFNAFDAESDSLNFTTNDEFVNITAFNTTSAILNYTYLQEHVGNRTLNIIVTDSKGASDNETFTITVNNTNDAPVLSTITFPSPIVETHAVYLLTSASDEDILLYGGVELLNFSSAFINGTTLFNITTQFDNTTNTSIGIISFTPGLNDSGNYTVNISVSDPQGAVDYQVINFEVHNKTQPPNITSIYPYGSPFNSSTIFAFRNTSDFASSNTTINATENNSILFNHTTEDDTTSAANLDYVWKYNGVNVSYNYSYTRNFDFFSSGAQTIQLIVFDDKRENTSWEWNIDVTNVNRAPLLLNLLDNVSVDSTETFSDYLEKRTNVKFIDPDDDLNSDDELGVGETNNLNFNVTTCSVATLTITNSDLKVTPEEIGSCTVTFTAYDSNGLNVNNSNVLINVTAVPNGTEVEVEVPTATAGGGGGGGGSASITIPTKDEIEVPNPLNLVVPEQVTIYRNRSISVPIVLENTWNGSLLNVTLIASTNQTGVEITLSDSHFEEIEEGKSETVELKATGYRLGGNFEIFVNATSQDPSFTDTANIYLNSIEQRGEGDDTDVRVTFARDLLSTNEECQELQELLLKAEEESNKGNFGEANKILDTVMNGCRYLVSKSQQVVEEPTKFKLDFLKRFNYFYTGVGILLFGFLIAIVVIEVRIRKEKHQEKK